MYLPPLQPIGDLETYASGDVTIDPSAVIAAGVILQAAPDCRILIAAGVCIGMGSILNAYQGNLEIAAGVTLGAGVLVVGNGKIGASAVIGSMATVLNPEIEAMQVVPPGVILGNLGKFTEVTAVMEEATVAEVPQSPAEATSEHQAENNTEQNLEATPENHTEHNPDMAHPSEAEEVTAEGEEEGAGTTLQTNESSQEEKTQVYGHAYVSRMMKTIFPYKA